MRPAHFEFQPLAGHGLVDSGGGEKLERFGTALLRRPEPQALWRPRLPAADWERADLVFERETDRGGTWRVRPGSPNLVQGRDPAWTIEVGPATLWIRPTPFKHVGIFPEQAANWRVLERLSTRGAGGEPLRLLNLFGYTGAASVLAALHGCRVTHVDASRLALDGCRQNAVASGVPDGRLRYVLEDALVFARREVRRGAKYSIVLLDPPHYGRGPKGQKWQLEEHLAELVELAGALSAERALIVLSTYAVGHSPLAFANLLDALEGGETAAGELVLVEESRAGLPARSLSQGFCARWWRGFEPADILP